MISPSRVRNQWVWVMANAFPVGGMTVSTVAVPGGDTGERVRHPDLAGRRVQNERVPGVEPLPAGHNLGQAAAADGGNLGRCRCAADLDEARIGQIAQREVVFIHPAFQLSRHSPVPGGPMVYGW
jgi:hypothetical protein